MKKERNRKLILEDGSEYYGTSFGSEHDKVCEIVFNTSMVGYQEILSDPSYTYQAVVMTYPLIGNYGMTEEDYETQRISIGAMIVGEYNNIPSNFSFTKTVADVLKEYDIPGIEGVDTRALTRSIRDKGSRRVLITSPDTSKEHALYIIKSTSYHHDSIVAASCKKRWYSRTSNHKYTVVVIDCGVKRSIIRELNARKCNVSVVPYDTSAAEILGMLPDGVVISNGPGDPRDAYATIETAKELRGRVPIFGICLGHQILALACGAGTYKMKYGHRGGNHPVKNLLTGKVEITSQNHGYAVDAGSFDGTGLEATHIDLLDGTVEGQRCEKEMMLSVQYHPEGAPGPHDSEYLFDDFIGMMRRVKKNA